MDTDVLKLVLFFIGPSIVGLLAWIYKSQLERLSMLERKIEDKTTEQQVRLILGDKLVPVQESLMEIKQKLEKLTDYLIENHDK